MSALPVAVALALLGAAAPPPSTRRAEVLVLPAVTRDGGSTSTSQALAQLLASALAERPGFRATLYEPAVYAARDPLVAVLARCEDLPCLQDLGTRLGAVEVVAGTLEGDPGTLRLVRVDTGSGRLVAEVEYALDDDTIARLAEHPEVIIGALYDGRPPPQATPPPHVTAPPRVQPRPRVARAETAPRPAVTASARVDVSPWLKMSGAAAVGGAVALALASALWVGAYGWVVAYDGMTVARTGRHAFTQRMAATLDNGFLLGLLMLGVLWPLGTAGAVALAAGFLL